MIRIGTLVARALLSRCIAGYTLVEPRPVPVAKGTFKVQSAIAWKQIPSTMLDTEELFRRLQERSN